MSQTHRQQFFNCKPRSKVKFYESTCGGVRSINRSNLRLSGILEYNKPDLCNIFPKQLSIFEIVLNVDEKNTFLIQIAG